MLLLKHKRITALFIIFSLLYLAQVLFGAPDQETLDKYHLTEGQLTALALTVALPYILIWAVALIGYLRLRALKCGTQ